MLWLNEREAFQALDRFAPSPHVTERYRFRILATKVLRMVRAGAAGVEVDEDFLNLPPELAYIKPSSITVVDMDGTTTTLPTWPVLDGVAVSTLRSLADIRELVVSLKPGQEIRKL